MIDVRFHGGFRLHFGEFELMPPGYGERGTSGLVFRVDEGHPKMYPFSMKDRLDEGPRVPDCGDPPASEVER